MPQSPLRRRPHPRRIVAPGLVSIVAAVLVSGCGGTADTRSETYGLPTTLQDLEAERWVLDGAASTPVVDAGTATLAFEDERVHGSAPCNTFAGPFEVDDDELSIGPLAATRRSCEDERMAAEAVVLGALEAVEQVDVDDDRLVLTGADATLVFDAADDDVTLEGAWTIVGVAGDDAVTAILAGTEATITLSPDGDATVTTGCNDLAVTWERDGDVLELGEVVQTVQACEEPAGVMDQEASLAAALERTASFELAPGRLTLLDAEDRMVLVATNTSDPDGS